MGQWKESKTDVLWHQYNWKRKEQQKNVIYIYEYGYKIRRKGGDSNIFESTTDGLKIFESPMTVWKIFKLKKNNHWSIVQILHKVRKRAVIWNQAKRIANKQI